jgi:enterochelin esterase family protein
VKRIHDLLARCEAVPSRANDEIRAFIATNTFPLFDGDTAIFFFWDERPFESISLMNWVFGLESRQSFIPLGKTGAWYLPLELPHRARVEYKLELVRNGQRLWIRDPLNLLRAFDPFGSNSVCTMPGYAPPLWVSPDEVKRPGSLATFQLESAIYGDTREIAVYRPSEFKPHKKYPLLICHDGRDYLRFASMVPVLDNLIQRHEVAPLLVAFTSGVDRNREYGANPNQPIFLVDELLPALRAQYRILEGPENVGAMGASFGAVSSLYAAWTRPGIFGKLLLQSGSFVHTDIGRHDRGPLFDPVVAFVNQLRSDPSRIGARVFMSCGTFESLIWFNRSLRALLKDHGLEVRFVESQDGHNWIAWRDRLRDGLTSLFPGHLWMYYD